MLADTDHEDMNDKGQDKAYDDDALLIIFNAHDHEHNFQLPKLKGDWAHIINTADCTPKINATTIEDSLLSIAAFSCSVLTYSQKDTQGL